jgi:hypothetical protein
MALHLRGRLSPEKMTVMVRDYPVVAPAVFFAVYAMMVVAPCCQPCRSTWRREHYGGLYLEASYRYPPQLLARRLGFWHRAILYRALASYGSRVALGLG